MVKRSKYLYHVTDVTNVDSIIREGLRRNAKRRTIAVYLSTKPMSWYQDGMRILKVDVSGLSCISATTFLPESDEVLFWGDIPPWKNTKNGYVPRITDVTDKFVKAVKPMRERLIKLIAESAIKGDYTYIPDVADHLLANGVIVPPMRLGQACFYPNRYLNKDDECRVSSITQKADGSFKIRLTNLCGRGVFEITADEIGKTVFLAREEAEKALKGGEGDG